MAGVQNEIKSETLQATSLPSASMPVPFLLSLLSPLLALSPPLSPKLILRDGLANSQLLVGCETAARPLRDRKGGLLPLLEPFCNCSVCLCMLCTHTHTYTLPYLQFCGMLPGTYFCPIHIFFNLIILLDLLLLYYYYFHSPVHASFHTCTQPCTYIVPCMRFCTMHMHVLFFCPHTYIYLLVSHTHIYSYIPPPFHTYLHLHFHALVCPHVSAMLAYVCTCAVSSFFILLLCTLFFIKQSAVGLLPAGLFLSPCMFFSINHCAVAPLFAGLFRPHCTLFFVKHCACARYSWSRSETTSAGRLLSPHVL